MHYGRKEVEKRASRLHSPVTNRIHKLQLIGVRFFLIGLIFICLFGISMMAGAFQSILSSAPNPEQIQIIPQGYTTSVLDTSAK